MILNYLRKNTDAGDTLEGIAKWWLEYERINSAMEEVTVALELLIKEGKVNRLLTGSDTYIYKICKNE